MDTTILLSQANAAINQIRHEALKPGLKTQFQALTKVYKSTDTTKGLFGDKLVVERIKNAKTSATLGMADGTMETWDLANSEAEYSPGIHMAEAMDKVLIFWVSTKYKKN